MLLLCFAGAHPPSTWLPQPVPTSTSTSPAAQAPAESKPAGRRARRAVSEHPQAAVASAPSASVASQPPASSLLPAADALLPAPPAPVTQDVPVCPTPEAELAPSHTQQDTVPTPTTPGSQSSPFFSRAPSEIRPQGAVLEPTERSQPLSRTPSSPQGVPQEVSKAGAKGRLHVTGM